MSTNRMGNESYVHVPETATIDVDVDKGVVTLTGTVANAASTADADAFIDERYSLNFDGTQSRDDADIEVAELQQFTTDDGGAHHDWVWNVIVTPTYADQPDFFLI